MTKKIQSLFKDPFDDDQWDDKNNYIGDPKEECEDAGMTYGALKDSDIKSIRGSKGGGKLKPHPGLDDSADDLFADDDYLFADDDGVIQEVGDKPFGAYPKDHTKSVGDAMVGKYAPKKPVNTPYYRGSGGAWGSGGHFNPHDPYGCQYGGHRGGYPPPRPTPYNAYGSSPKPKSTSLRNRDDNITNVRNVIDTIVGDTLADASEAEVQLVTELVAKDVGQLLDGAGLVWGSGAGVELRTFLQKFLTENVKVVKSIE